MKWSNENVERLRVMIEAKLSIKQISAITGWSYGAITGQRCIQKLPTFSGRTVASPKSRHPAVQEPLPEDRLTYANQTKSANQIASQWHLIDLKRAGHSPTRTELKIAPDAIAPMRMAIPLCQRSLTGSLGAMCADNAGRGY